MNEENISIAGWIMEGGMDENISIAGWIMEGGMDEENISIVGWIVGGMNAGFPKLVSAKAKAGKTLFGPI